MLESRCYSKEIGLSYNRNNGRKNMYTGFDNYHKIAICNHMRQNFDVCVPTFWSMWCTWANPKKLISGVTHFT